MCLLFLSFSSDTSQPYKLVLVFNRDELYSRPTTPAQFWDDDNILAGAIQYNTVQYSTFTVEYSRVQYSRVQYSRVQYSTVEYSTVEYSRVQ